MKERILQFLFPPKCVLCRKLLSREETDLCHDCRELQPEYGTHKIKLSFLAQWTGLWYYKENVRLSILRYKFAGRRSYAAAYGRLLAMKLMKEGWDTPDMLTWVPISRQRKRKRGYDQVELFGKVLAKELGKLSGIKLDDKMLVRVKNTKPQKELSDKERNNNIESAFQIRINDLKYSKVILVDDIYTTGATINECAKVLLDGGVGKVYFITACIGNGF